MEQKVPPPLPKAQGGGTEQTAPAKTDSSALKTADKPAPIAKPTPGSPDTTKANPVVKMVTSEGDITIEMFEDGAPNTVANFISLVEKKFYDGLTFHRYEPGFVVQGGDPLATGEGGPGYCIRLEAKLHHELGAIAMAREGPPDTAGSQFYFVLDEQRCAALDTYGGGYAVFGKITKGLDVMNKLRMGAKIVSATVVSKRAHEYVPATLPDPHAAERPKPPVKTESQPAGGK
jgi:peptidyl-prolyl cis-trans isomerase B (cyclophilin B)